MALIQFGNYKVSDPPTAEEIKNILSGIQKEVDSIRNAISGGVTQTAVAGQTLTIKNGLIIKVE